MESCTQIWLPTGAQSNCIALWEECTGQTSSCCGPATCFGDSSHAACVPLPSVTSHPTKSPSSQPTSSCTVCTDIETYWMANNGKDCTTSNLIYTKCNKDATWESNKFCQKSCYEAGYGYAGDVCCDWVSRRLHSGVSKSDFEGLMWWDWTIEYADFDQKFEETLNWEIYRGGMRNSWYLYVLVRAFLWGTELQLC